MTMDIVHLVNYYTYERIHHTLKLFQINYNETIILLWRSRTFQKRKIFRFKERRAFLLCLSETVIVAPISDHQLQGVGFRIWFFFDADDSYFVIARGNGDVTR